MKVMVDDKLKVSLFGTRSPKTDSIRYYYQVVGYGCLVLVLFERDYKEWQNERGIALFNFDQVNGGIICSLFPKAPASWQNHTDLIQVSIRPDRRFSRGHKTKTLSDAVYHMIGKSC